MQYNPLPENAPTGPLRWNARMVSDSGGAEAAAIRNYLEQRVVREALTFARAQRPATAALDVGAGFGRISCVLTEFAPRVTAVERDPGLLEIGKALNPAVDFVAIARLDRLPLADGAANLALTFTVLQHLPDDECQRVLAEIRRIVPIGHILLVEETDEAFGPHQFRPETGMHLGRSASRYSAWMPGWTLVRTWPRRVEPTYRRVNVGTAMLFTRIPTNEAPNAAVPTDATPPIAHPRHDRDPPAPLAVPQSEGGNPPAPLSPVLGVLGGEGLGVRGLTRLELACGNTPTAGYIHHDRRHSPHTDVVHDLDTLPWPWPDASCEEILGLEIFEHLHLMPEAWLRECHRILTPGGTLRLRVPIFGSPWHLIDPTHVRGFHPLNFDYFIRGRELHQKFGQFYFDFAFQSGTVQIESHNILATLQK